MRDEVKHLRKEYDKTEDDLKALQSVGQIIGEVLRQLDAERYIVKASSGPRYVVGCRSKIDKEKLVQGTRVTLDMTTLTIMRALPREVRHRQPAPAARLFLEGGVGDFAAPRPQKGSRGAPPARHSFQLSLSLPRQVDPVVFHMKAEEADTTSYSNVGGLNEQIREMREVKPKQNSASEKKSRRQR